LAAQIAIMLTSSSGSVRRRQESLAMLDGLAPAYGDDWWFLGSYAFAHHEVDRFEESRRLADRSLALKPSNAGAAHPMAHVFFEYAAKLTAQPGVAFLDVHAALAYTAMGDEAAMTKLLDGLQAVAERGSALTMEVVLPLARGLQAFGQGNFLRAISLIEPLSDQIVRVGGSHAQREVFEDTLLQACFKTGRFEQGETLLRKRLSQRSSARDAVWLEQATAAGTRPTAAKG